MFSFFIRSIAFQLRKERSVIFLFVLGICVCILCVLSTMGNFGYSANNIIKQKEYSTITFNPDENTAKNARAVIDYADSLSRQGLYNVILVTPLGEGKYVLGWLGYGYDFWMAPSSGRFFSEEEQQKGQNVAYVSECIVNHLEDPNYLNLDEETYQIIGSTFIVNHDFFYVVPEESEVQLFFDGSQEKDIFNQYEFVILPYETYMRRYQPQQILIQYYDGTPRNMQHYEKKLRDRFPESTAYKPDHVADETLDAFSQRHEVLAYIFCIAAGLTLIQLISEWMKIYQEDFAIYYLVGLSSRRIIGILYLQIFVYLVIGAVLGFFLFALLSPYLAALHIGNIYYMDTVLKVIGAVMIFIYICFSVLVLFEFRVVRRRYR